MGSTIHTVLLYLLLITVILTMLSIVYKSWSNGISPMPASLKVRQAVAAEINRISQSGTIVDAGSGWGTLALHLAKHCPGRKVIGIENSPVPAGISRFFLLCLAAMGLKGDFTSRTTFIYGDMYDYPYSTNDMLVCYLYPGAMQRINEITDMQLLDNTRILSVCFALPGREPERVITCRDMYRTKLYVYFIEK